MSSRPNAPAGPSRSENEMNLRSRWAQQTWRFHHPELQRRRSVADQHAATDLEEPLERQLPAVLEDLEHGDGRRRDGPQRQQDTGAKPARAVGVLDPGVQRLRPCLGDRRFDGTADLPFDRAHRPERDPNAEQIPQQSTVLRRLRWQTPVSKATTAISRGPKAERGITFGRRRPRSGARSGHKPRDAAGTPSCEGSAGAAP